jgi:hypothetical protein
MHCCDVCSPDRFIVETIVLEKRPGLTCSRKRKLPTCLAEYLRTELENWRETVLLPAIYLNISVVIVSPEVLLPDEIIDVLISCGKEI